MKNKKTLLGIGLSGLALASFLLILAKSDVAIAECGVNECCWECKANFYRSGISCLACPDGTSSASGSDSLDDCKQAGCGPAVTGSFTTAPTTGLCTSESSSSSMNTGDSKFSWTCTYLGSATSCNATRAYNCNGTTPGGTGYTRGGFTRPYGYTPTSWTYTSSQNPGACQWTCKSGYEKSGNDCVVKSAQCGTATVNWYVTAPTESLCTYGTPSIVTSGNNTFTWTCTNLTSTDNCSATRKYSCGTAPSGNGVSKGSYFRDYNYTPASWTYSTNSPLGECEWSCKDGYEKSGNTCVASQAQCGDANGGTYTSAPTTGLCDLGDSSVVTPWDFTYTWTCTHLTNTANCNATRNHFCEGTTPSGDGVNRGLMTASTPKDWTYKAEGTLGECEWSCDEGYTSGANNTCVSLPAQCGDAAGGLAAPTTGLCNRGTPSNVTTGDSEFTWTCSYQGNSTVCSAPRTYLCNGTTPPTSNGTLKGSFTREYSYAPTSWTYKAEGELGACQWRCKGGYLSGGGNTCIASDFKELEMYFLTNAGATGYYAMMDRNLGATAYMNEPGKTASEWYGNYYQWGNNYGFPNQGTINTSSTQVNASSYGPNNYYSSDTFVIGKSDWANPSNNNLWGGNGSESDRKGPCPLGYHLPTNGEFNNIINDYWKKSIKAITGLPSLRMSDSLMPLAGSYTYSATIHYQESYGYYWSSVGSRILGFSISANNISSSISENRASGLPVRCFKNTQTPSKTINPNGGTGALIVVHDGVITKLGTPTKGTEVFGGWYRDAGFTSQVDVGDAMPNLYAKWEVAQCGSANGKSYLSLTYSSEGLCSTGNVGNFSELSTGFTWKCTYGSNVVSCSANRKYPCEGTSPHGERAMTGASYYTGSYTPTSWTYQAEGNLGACKWRCTAGYMQGPDNTCVVGVGQCGTAAGNSHTDLSETSANLCAGGQVVQFSQRGATYYWKCYGLSNQVECCATQSIERNNRVQEGAGTFKICNPNNSEECLTLQNHDLGSSAPGLCSPSYGKFYQRGNNYGFANSGSVSTSTTQVTCNNPPYNRSQFVIGFDNWCAGSQSSVLGNLWGGYTDFSNLNTNYGYPMLNSTDRQGPCPSGYHVPSKGEWKKVMEWWVAWYNLDGNSLTIDTSSNNYKFSDGTAIKMFQNDFLIPLGGSRLNTSSTAITNRFATAWLWTSTPNVSDSSSFHLYLDNLGIGANGRADGVSVRCFKDNTLSQCGPASTGSFVTAPTDSLCNPGTPSAVTSGSSTFTWTCTYGASVANCSATRMYPCEGPMPSGNGVTRGGITAPTSKSWTYKANGELGACEWRCNGGYTQGTNNTCDTAGYSDLEMYFLTNAGATGYYAMMDRNLGATAYMNELGKTASEWYGNYYQWGNNYGFANAGTIKTSTTLVNASSYGPNNYYSSDTFIGGNDDWSSVRNDNLWGDTTNTNIARKGPCPSGYHVPTRDELVGVVENYWSKSVSNTAGSQRVADSLMPLAGYRFIDFSVKNQGSQVFYWTSTRSSDTQAYVLSFNSSSIYYQAQGFGAGGFAVRCFKNTQTPLKTINPNGGTGALIVVHDGKITKLGTPTKGTEVFGGWYRDAGFTSQVDVGDAMPNLYAKWEIAQCGSASGQSYVSLTSSSAGLCDTGNAGNFSTTTTGYTWKCTHGSNVASCSATRVYSGCAGTMPSGTNVVTGVSTYTYGHTPTTWTYKADGELGACEWRCDADYFPDGNNHCVTLQESLCGPYNPSDFQDLDMYFVTSTGAQGHYTMMDRNLGATEVYDGTADLCTYGYYYQWGNNYGFPGTGSILSSRSRVDASGYGPNNYYSSDTFINIYSVDWNIWWSSTQNNNLWGGVTNTNEAMRGPCPSGYHVPSRDDFVNIVDNYWKNSQDNRKGGQWGLDSLMPYAGFRDTGVYDRDESELISVGSAFYWASTHYDTNNSYMLYFNSFNTISAANAEGTPYYPRYHGLPVRCFKNTPNSLTIHPNGGTKAMIVVHGGEITKLGTPTKAGASFGGWYRDSSFTSQVHTGDLVPASINLYAKWESVQCGSASGQTYVTLTSSSAGLCDAGNTVIDFQSGANNFTWKCSTGSVTVNCSATRIYECGGTTPSGIGMSKGTGIVNTPTDWTYSPTGTLGACQWMCADGYVSGANNTCVEPQCQINFSDFQDLDMYFITNAGTQGHYTLMDRNLGATAYMNEPGKTADEWYGNYYQWGNNCGFPGAGTIKLSTTKVDASGYGPNNYYLNDTFINIYSSDWTERWSSTQNNNLWGGVTNTNTARQGPCPSGYHVPSRDDFVNIVDNYWKNSQNNVKGGQWGLDSLMPYAGFRDTGVYDRDESELISVGYAFYWASTHYDTNNSYMLYFNTNNTISAANAEGTPYYPRYHGLPVRCFKNTPNSNLTIHPNGGTGAEIIVHNGVITKLGTPSKGTETFGGWYSDSSFTSQVNTGEAAPSNLYAKWEVQCQAGYYFDGNNCAQCTAGYYCPGDSTRHPCGAGKYSLAGATSCLNVACGCKGTSTTATTSCPTVCPDGQYSSAGSSTCQYCGNGPSNSVYTHSSSRLCTNSCPWMCADGFVEKDGECVCEAGTYFDENEKKCLPCPEGYDKGREGAENIEQCMAHCELGTYMENKFEKCVKCPAGTAIPDHDVAYGKISVEMDEELKCQDCNNLPKDGNAHYTGPSNDITSCPWECDKNYYKNSTNTCTSCPPRHYTDYAGAGSIDQCKIDCTGGTYIPSQQVAIQLGCISCSEGMATGAHTLHRGQFSSCVSCNEEYLPTNATFSGAGSNPNNCPWKCKAGYYKSGNVCRSCSEFNTSSAQYSSHTGATSSLDCFQLPKCGSANGQYFIYDDYPNGPISNLCDWGTASNMVAGYGMWNGYGRVCPANAGPKCMSEVIGWSWNCSREINGVTYAVSCMANKERPCAGPCGTVEHGQSLTCYNVGSTTCPDSCNFTSHKQTRVCENGVWKSSGVEDPFPDGYYYYDCQTYGLNTDYTWDSCHTGYLCDSASVYGNVNNYCVNRGIKYKWNGECDKGDYPLASCPEGYTCDHAYSARYQLSGSQCIKQHRVYGHYRLNGGCTSPYIYQSYSNGTRACVHRGVCGPLHGKCYQSPPGIGGTNACERGTPGTQWGPVNHTFTASYNGDTHMRDYWCRGGTGQKTRCFIYDQSYYYNSSICK